MAAAFLGSMETFQVLLEHGVTWKPQDEIVIPPGFRRRWNGWLRRLLRKKRPNIINQTCCCRRYYEGQTLLHAAAKGGNTPLVKWLLDADADPNILNIYGDSPLDWAELEHSEEVTQCLRDADAKRGKDLPHETNECDMESEYSGLFGRSE